MLMGIATASAFANKSTLVLVLGRCWAGNNSLCPGRSYIRQNITQTETITVQIFIRANLCMEATNAIVKDAVTNASLTH